MYAIIEQGSKQYKVSVGDVINIELTEASADAKTIEAEALNDANVQKWTTDKTVRKVIVVPGRLINIAVS